MENELQTDILRNMSDHLIDIDTDLNDCYVFISTMSNMIDAISPHITTLDKAVMTLRNRILRLENYIEELIENDESESTKQKENDHEDI